MRLSSVVRVASGISRLTARRRYTSYPDPNEKPRITTSIHAQSDLRVVKQFVDKSSLKLDAKFRLESVFPGVPESKGLSSSDPPQTKSTKLRNGVTVSTQDIHGLMSSFAFVVAAGSSNEVQAGGSALLTTGVTQIVELTAFGNTQKRTHQELSAEMEKLGGMVQCISSREQIMFCVDVLRENVEQALEILADTVLAPRLSDEDIAQAREIISLQANELPADMLSRDAVTMAAFKGSPLGNSHFCPHDAAARITRSAVQSFREKFFVGDRCVSNPLSLYLSISHLHQSFFLSQLPHSLSSLLLTFSVATLLPQV